MPLLFNDTLGHKNNFDFTRFVLAAMVIYSHSYLVYYGPIVGVKFEPSLNFTKYQIAFGTIAVNFFFIISGFLVLQSFIHSKSYFDYLKKRVLRIYPAFIVTILVCAFIIAPLGNGSLSHPVNGVREYWSQIDIKTLARVCFYLKDDLYFLPDTFANIPAAYELNTSIWTIHLEFICYIIIMFLGILRLFKMHQLIPFAILLLVLYFNIIHFNVYAAYNAKGTVDAAAIPYFPKNYFENFLNMEHLLLFFMSGACFYYYRKYIPRSRYLLILSAVVIIVTSRWIKVFELAQVFFGAYILFYMIFSSRFKMHNFGKYGDISYGVYLYGWPVQQMVMVYFGAWISYTGSLLFSFAALIPIAFLSWHIIEKPALSLKKKHITAASFNRLKKLVGRQ